MFGNITESPVTLVSVLLAGIGSLAATVTFLYRQNSAANKLLTEKLEAMNLLIEKELQECKSDRDKIWEQLREIQKGGGLL